MHTIFIPKRNYLKIALAFAVLLLLAGFFLLNPVASVISENLGAPIYKGSADQNNVSFAINVDWGEEYIPKMLAIFEENEIKCTFFLTGRWVENNKDLAKAIKDKGHEIGNHAYSHTSPNSLSKAKNADEITKTATAIKEATGVNTALYAPPSGECEEQVLAAALETGHHTILWSVDTIDWQKPSPETIISRVIVKAESGSIILMHPTENTVSALSTLISELNKKNLEIVPVSVNANLDI
jgi:probable sporulation protein (polysaccharide deacetylase family)